MSRKPSECAVRRRFQIQLGRKKGTLWFTICIFHVTVNNGDSEQDREHFSVERCLRFDC